MFWSRVHRQRLLFHFPSSRFYAWLFVCYAVFLDDKLKQNGSTVKIALNNHLLATQTDSHSTQSALEQIELEIKAHNISRMREKHFSIAQATPKENSDTSGSYDPSCAQVIGSIPIGRTRNFFPSSFYHCLSRFDSSKLNIQHHLFWQN